MKPEKKPRKSVKPGKKKNESTWIAKKGISIPVTLPCELHEWSETLTYEQISDTLFAVNVYLSSEHPDAITDNDKKVIDAWLNKGNLDKFLTAKNRARIEYQSLLEKEAFVQDIMSQDIKYPMSH